MNGRRSTRWSVACALVVLESTLACLETRYLGFYNLRDFAEPGRMIASVDVSQELDELVE